MSERFSNLKKIPDEPALRLLANANTRLNASMTLPANAPVSAMLVTLDEMGAFIDILRLMAVAMPGRERTWWSCLAGRDLVHHQALECPRTLKTAEDWVRRPGDTTRMAVQQAIDTAPPEDDLVLCATSALFADGTLGPGDKASYPAPPGGSEMAAFGMNLMALEAHALPVAKVADLLIDRALDIARGGSGQMQSDREQQDAT